jgi:hypothetical protein
MPRSLRPLDFMNALMVLMFVVGVVSLLLTIPDAKIITCP